MPFDGANRADQDANLDDLVNLEPGFAFESEQFTFDEREGRPLIRIRDLGHQTTTCRYSGKFEENYVVRNGDILVGMDGQFIATRWAGEDALLNQRVLRVRSADPTLLDEGYLFYRLQPDLARLEETITGTTVKHLSTKDIKRLRWSLPPLEEQKLISEVLRSADQAILTAQAIVNNYAGLIQREADTVIARLYRDVGVKSVKLGEVAAVRGGKRLPKGSNYEVGATQNRYIRVTDWHDYEIRPQGVRYISDEVASAIKRYTISTQDIFISIAGSIGLVGSVPESLNGAYLTENAAKIVIGEDKGVDLTYLLIALRSTQLADQIRQQKGVGGGVPKLALFRIEELVLPLPSIEDQRQIAASYLGLKAARGLSAEALVAARTLKSVLAADLLSGRVRVPA